MFLYERTLEYIKKPPDPPEGGFRDIIAEKCYFKAELF
jgi:hypothetical protein